MLAAACSTTTGVGQRATAARAATVLRADEAATEADGRAVASAARPVFADASLSALASAAPAFDQAFASLATRLSDDVADLRRTRWPADAKADAKAAEAAEAAWAAFADTLLGTIQQMFTIAQTGGRSANTQIGVVISKLSTLAHSGKIIAMQRDAAAMSKLREDVGLPPLSVNQVGEQLGLTAVEVQALGF
jgi:hypothetical protein